MERLTKENYYDSQRVSNSSLNWILPETGGSVQKFTYKTTFPQEEEESDSMRLGTLIHKFVEQGYNANAEKLFEVCEIPSDSIAKIIQDVAKNPSAPIRDEVLRVARLHGYQPNWKDDTVINKILGEGEKYLEKLKLETEGKILVSEEEWKQLSMICNNLQEFVPWNFDKEGFMNEVNMTPGHGEPGDDVQILNECAVEFEYQEIESKALIDILIVNHTRKTLTIVDLKTTSVPLSIYTGYNTQEINDEGKIVDKFVEGTMYKRNVHRQLAFYKIAAESLYKGYTFNSAYVLALETNIPYEVTMAKVNNAYLELGKKRIDYAFECFKRHCLFESDWSLYGS